MTVAPVIYINGRFVAQPRVTGVERYALEMVRALDGHVEALAPEARPRLCLLTPRGLAAQAPMLKAIEVREGGKGAGHLWQQISLPRLSHDGFLINLCNSGPVVKKDMLTVIHDALIYRHPGFFDPRYRLLHGFLGRSLAARSHLATVSAFSSGELAQVFKLAEAEIPVFPNGSDHIRRSLPDDGVLGRLGLRPGGFLLFVGSQAPQKDLPTAIEAYRRLDRTDIPFVVVGAGKTRAFGAGLSDVPNGVLLAGRLSDEEIAGLYRHAMAFVFPSLYEGFGIPPLEAMTLGCPVIASNIAPCREVCADAALYFEAGDPEALVLSLRRLIEDPTLRQRLSEQGRLRADVFSWSASAARLLDHVRKLAS